jgi:hypothetical protein
MSGGTDSNQSSGDDNSIIELADGTTAGAGKPKQKVDSDSRAWVDAKVSNISGGIILSTSKKLRYDDMNAGMGGVARGTTITTGAAATTVYSYTGSGVLSGFLINLESASSSSDNWQINLLVDGEEIFNSVGIRSNDLISSSVYDYGSAGAREPFALGLEMSGSAIYFSTSPNFPVRYETSVAIKVKKLTGGNKMFNAGLVILTKET